MSVPTILPAGMRVDSPAVPGMGVTKMQGGACELKPALGKYLGISASYPQDPRSDQCVTAHKNTGFSSRTQLVRCMVGHEIDPAAFPPELHLLVSCHHVNPGTLRILGL